MDDKYLGGKFWSEIYFFRLKGLIHDFHRGKKKKLSPAICRFCCYNYCFHWIPFKMDRNPVQKLFL